ncbi:thioredoxin [Flexithrix dorotheae]|uniref:thioredoxin n=1 Tax=Flexithrix dorotheae TaxID=70993 RepID=UPI0003651AE0|nr:thioredoxin [Flexithrix dorotheae]
MLQPLNNSNFEETIRNNDVVVVDFYADWCGQCQAIHPILEDISDDFKGKATLAKVNVDQFPELSGEYGIKSIPTLLFFNKGDLVKRKSNTISKEGVKAEITQLIV